MEALLWSARLRFLLVGRHVGRLNQFASVEERERQASAQDGATDGRLAQSRARRRFLNGQHGIATLEPLFVSHALTIPKIASPVKHFSYHTA
jgi:hypothetical protein